MRRTKYLRCQVNRRTWDRPCFVFKLKSIDDFRIIPYDVNLASTTSDRREILG